jgi:hypothetical protein
MSLITITPKKAPPSKTYQFDSLKRGDTFRKKGDRTTFMKMDEFREDEDDTFNCVVLVSGKEYHVVGNEPIVRVTCYLEIHDEVS